MTKKLPLDDSNETKFYCDLVTKLKTDSNLSRVIKKWCVYSGDNSEIAEPTSSDLPYLRIAPSSDYAETTTETRSQAPMTLDVGLIVEGTRAGDILNLWNAVRKAIFPGDQSMQALLNKYSAAALTLHQPAYGVGTIGKNASQMLVASGSLSVKFTVGTML
ncbi:hypothetical protein ACYOEI_00040 [Singulisphaera rosea]